MRLKFIFTLLTFYPTPYVLTNVYQHVWKHTLLKKQFDFSISTVSVMFLLSNVKDLFIRKMRRSTYKKCLKILSILILSFFIFCLFLPRKSDFVNNDLIVDVENDDKIDWNDYEFMAYENKRTGPGEKGKPVILNYKKYAEVKKNNKFYKLEGIYSVANDRISPNRSLPDVRINV